MSRTKTLGDARRNERIWSYIFVAPITVQLVLFVALPVGIAIFAAFTNWNILAGEMSFVGFQNFTEFLGDDKFWKSVVNTFFMLIPIPFYLVFGLLLALACQRKTPGHHVFRTLFFLPYVSSIVAVVVLWKWLFNYQFGPINQMLSHWFGIQGPDWLGDPDWVKVTIVIMITWKMIGITSIYFLAGLNAIPDAYTEAARIDGAGTMRVFFGITLPLLSPTMFFLVVVGMIGSLQTFVEVQLFTPQGGTNYSSSTITFYIWDKAFGDNQMGYACAVALFFALAILAITLFQFRLSKRWVHLED